MGLDCKILDLISSSAGKAAPYMTRGLREIGNGSMAEGISAIRDYSIKYGMELGEKTGIKKVWGLGFVPWGCYGVQPKFWSIFANTK